MPEGCSSECVILQQISVIPSRQNQGIATRVLQDLVHVARKMGRRLMVQSIMDKHLRRAVLKIGGIELPYDNRTLIVT